MKNAILIFKRSIILSMLLPAIAFGQDLPKIIPPAPSTSALFRFQDYPMDYSTGLPQISIPIYEVKSGSLSVPISISYHASGRRVYDQDGTIALGWSLNAGGVISRTINGSPDFGSYTYGTYKFPYPFKLSADLGTNSLADLQYFEKITHFYKTEQEISTTSFLDAEYDIFSYSFNGLGGKFLFKDANNVKTPVLLPFRPYVITPTYDNFGISKFEFTDDKGIVYQFIPGDTYSSSVGNATSSWILSKILSADKVDTISFVYSSFYEERKTISQQRILIDKWQMLNEAIPFPNPSDNTPPWDLGYYNVSRLSQILFRNGKVLFNLVNNDKVSSIQILNANNQAIKTIQLNRSECDSHSELGFANTKLDALVLQGKDGANVETYSFEYYPSITDNGQMNVRYRDWWGYYNASGAFDMVPTYMVPDVETTNGPIETIQIGNHSENREPNLNAIRSGVLKKIIYPGGGNTEFIYEHNQCILRGTEGFPRTGPGLRVYQIKTTDNTGSSSIKTYKYGTNESGYGTVDIMPEMKTMAKEEIFDFLGAFPFGPGPFYPSSSGSYRQRTFYSDFLPELSDLAQRPVFYKEVTEYIGTEINNIGKTIYSYDEGAEWNLYTMSASDPMHLYPLHIYNYDYWNHAVLKTKTDYKKIDNGGVVSFQKRKESISNYLPTTTEYINGLHVRPIHILTQTGKDNQSGYYAEKYLALVGSNYPISGPKRIYSVSDYRIAVGYKNLTSTTEKIYNDDGTIVSDTIIYEYNAKQYVSKTTTTTSDRTTLANEVKYPFDYTGDVTLNQMVGLNMLNFPIEQMETRGSSIPVKSIRTTYFNWGTTPARIYPLTIDAKKGGGAYETRIRYHAYDGSGNVLTVSKEDDVKKTYVWGYNKSYPIAEVVGVDHATITANVSLNQSVLVNTQATDQAVRDEVKKVRLAFPAAQVTTYTYKPLEGVSSQTDLNGRTIFYEYDPYGRLKLIKDKDNNVIKTFKYKYQSPTQ